MRNCRTAAFFALLAAQLPAADSSMTLRIVAEDTPAGGTVQVKVFLEAPQQVALEVANDLMNLDNDLSPESTGELDRINARIDHRPLASPVAANLIASVDMAALHSICPDHILVHARKDAFHVASIEPLVKAFQDFQLIEHSESRSGIFFPDTDCRTRG